MNTGIKLTPQPVGDRCTVHSLAQVEAAPDTLPITAALQTSLDLQEILMLFLKEAGQHLKLSGLAYRMDEDNISVQHGNTGNHRATYGLSLYDQSLGEITLYNSKRFSEQDLALVEHLLCALLHPLRNALQYHAALENALVDPLTGIHNRTALEQTLQREIEMARRHRMPLALALIDLDHFKNVNDTHGHAIGDNVLRHTAMTIGTSLRTTDRLFRFGGEEFVVLLMAIDEVGSRSVCERIRENIGSKPLHKDEKHHPITASIGYALLDGYDTRDSFFDKADKALYTAKKRGRDRVVAFSDVTR